MRHSRAFRSRPVHRRPRRDQRVGLGMDLLNNLSGWFDLADLRHAYAQLAVGDKADWDKIINMLAHFDLEMDKSKFKWEAFDEK